jgi:N6-L-threonylcarbamoyladenine synthase
MIRAILGLDTSNYRTSLALVTMNHEILVNVRRLLPVERGERGIRQCDAVYAHLKQLKSLMMESADLFSGIQLTAVCASTAPRERKDSYMPVFEAGDTIGRSISAAMRIPFFPTDHQHGHIRAARFGTDADHLDSMLTLHLSGGTTDLLCMKGDSLTLLGTSLDLHAGQLIDRIGVALGLSFPAGPEMEELAMRGKAEGRLGCSLDRGTLSCHMSGAEAAAFRWISAQALSPEDIAREIFDFLCRTSLRMLEGGSNQTGLNDALVFGGIASSFLFREMLEKRLKQNRSRLRVRFGAPELSGDNAVGVALIGVDRLRREEGDACENS